VRRIEVKGWRRGQPVRLTANEWLKARQVGDTYGLPLLWGPAGAGAGLARGCGRNELKSGPTPGILKMVTFRAEAHGGRRVMQQLASGAQRLGIPLTDSQLQAFEVYYETLIAWNRRVNLTRITVYEEVQVKHFLDSLSCLPLIQRAKHDHTGEPTSAFQIIDVGAGAGFPGVALRIADPGLQLTLLEATRKKAEFLQFLVERLGLQGVTVINARAEEAGQNPMHREQYDLALARAVAEMATLAELTLPLVRVGGLVIAHKGEDPTHEVAVAQKAIATLGARLEKISPIAIQGLGGVRNLVVLQKVSPTPPRYPRRPGIPTKRPLN